MDTVKVLDPTAYTSPMCGMDRLPGQYMLRYWETRYVGSGQNRRIFQLVPARAVLLSIVPRGARSGLLKSRVGR